MSRMIRIAVLISVHNRWSLTSKLISDISSSGSNLQYCIHIVDDGSTDETQSQLSSMHGIKYIRSDGTLFWAKAMKLAQDSVTESVDYYLWLNNDVEIEPNFHKVIKNSIESEPHSILVGQTVSHDTGMITYGGLIRPGRHPHRLIHIGITEEPVKVDTFSGNIVLIPKHVNDVLGGIDGKFQHGYADFDFGLRAKKMNIKAIVMPGILGKCDRNPNPFQNNSRFRNFRIILSKKYLPLRSQILFSRRHAGNEWVFYVVAPYIKLLFRNNLPLQKKIM